MITDPGPRPDPVLDAMSEPLYVVDTDRRITYWNPAAEQLTGHRAVDVLGHRCRDGILNHVDEAGRQMCHDGCPLLATMNDGQPRVARLFLHHRAGHRVPVEVHAAVLRDEEQNVIGAVETFHDDGSRRALARSCAEAESRALTDELTGLPNRRFLEDSLRRFAGEDKRYGRPYAVLFIDIDHFKAVNDRLGHDAGDEVLAMVARTLQGCVRDGDVAGRWGGEEFLVLAPADSESAAVNLAERLRQLVASSWTRAAGRRARVTISVGVAVSEVGETARDLVERSDAAMLGAKRDGRNRLGIG